LCWSASMAKFWGLNQSKATREAQRRIDEAEESRASRLDLSRLGLTEIPERLSRLFNLEVLDLKGNQISEIPETVFRLSALRILELSNNQIAEIPESIRDLKNLVYLYLHGNAALGIPDEILGPTWFDVMNRWKEPAYAKAILDYYFSQREGSHPLNESKLIL